MILMRHGRDEPWPTTLAAAAAVTLVVFVPTEDPYTTKRGVALALQRKRGEGSARMQPGETLSPGDSVFFEVRTEGTSGYVAVVSRDAAGAVTVYYPYDGPAAVPHDAREALLPDAIELGEGEGEEVVYALFSSKPFSLDWAVAALKEGKDLASAAPMGVSVGWSSFVGRARPSRPPVEVRAPRNRGLASVVCSTMALPVREPVREARGRV